MTIASDNKQGDLDAFFADWCERMERLRVERAREIGLECWEPQGLPQ